MATSDKKSLVHPGDILAAVRTLYGSSSRLLGYKVKMGTETVQGFASLMLRAKVSIKTAHGQTREVNLMVKRGPTMAAHAAMIESMGNIIAREGAFFNDILPHLQDACPELPVVRALVAHDKALVMEDLCDAGFRTMCRTMADMGRGHVLTYPMARMILRKLAKVHAASLNKDWPAIMPPGFFSPDPVLEGASAEQFKKFVTMSVMMVVIPIMKKIYLDTPSINDYITYMSSSQFFDSILQFVKFDPAFHPNVLLHGDCHLNNVMFKLDEQKRPVDMKFIDFQIIRYGPPTVDISYFLYTSAGKEFRDKHEEDLLKTYVEAFNTEASVTPDVMSLADLTAHYEKVRYFGMVISLAMRPMQFIPEFQPPETDGGELSEEFFEGMNEMDKFMNFANNAFDNDPLFNTEMRQLISHSMAVMHKFVYPQ